MPTLLNPYLSFQGNAREVMEFYQNVFGGSLDMMTFKDFNMSQDPSQDNLIMHAFLRGENGPVIMGADTPSGMPYDPGNHVSLSLSGEDEAELRGYWEKLADGATIMQPLQQASWGDIFGMLTDKYGIQWMVNINKQSA